MTIVEWNKKLNHHRTSALLGRSRIASSNYYPAFLGRAGGARVYVRRGCGYARLRAGMRNAQLACAMPARRRRRYNEAS